LIFLTLFCGAAEAQDHPTITGNYRTIAACVYRALDPMSPGNFRFTDLGTAAEITFETSGGGMTFRAMKATFSKISDNVTAIEIEGQPPGHYPSKVRPLAAECADKNQQPPKDGAAPRAARPR